MMSDDRWLQEKFDLYNRMYFRGRLPRYRVRLSSEGLSGGAHGTCDSKRQVIRLAGFAGPLTLLHEMCHIGTANHGKRFQAKLRRLAALGVSGAVEEAKAYADAISWNDEQRELREKLDEIANTVKPRPTFRRLVSGLAANHHGTIRGFLQTFPWVRAAWRRACEKADLPEEVRRTRLDRWIARYKREQGRQRAP